MGHRAWSRVQKKMGNRGWLTVTGYTLRVTRCELRVVGCVGCGGYELRATGFGLWVTRYGQLVAGCSIKKAQGKKRKINASELLSLLASRSPSLISAFHIPIYEFQISLIG